MKYGIISLLFFLNNEIFSLIALNIMVLFFLGDCGKSYEYRAKYNQYKRERMEKERRNGQISIFDDKEDY